MNKGPALILAGTILTVTLVSTVLLHKPPPPVIRQTNAYQTNDHPTLLPQSLSLPHRPDRSPLQAAAYVHFTDLFSTNRLGLVPPVTNFLDRITKKPFGMFITPETSPVEHDRFTGYHTGVDVEFTDTLGDVPVYAIADGTIIVRDWAKGYGGVIVIRHIINGVPLYVLYGHLNQASFPPAQVTQVTTGQQIAVLGDDHSQETDGVRKHLHLSISTTEKLDMRGYVETKEELTHWLNPLDFYE